MYTQHKGGVAAASEKIAHDECTSAVIPFKIELRLAQNAYIDSRCPLPGRLVFMPLVPPQDGINVVSLLMIKPLTRGLNMLVMFLSVFSVEPTEHQMVEFEQTMKMR